MRSAEGNPFGWRYVVTSLLIGVAVWIATRGLWHAERALLGTDGRFGYRPDPEGTRKFLDELGTERYFADAAGEAMQKAAEVDTFLYRYMDKAHRQVYGSPFVVGRQLIGDCTSWGAMHAVYAAESVDWSLGKLQRAPLMASSEAIYGGGRVEARGLNGDGRSPVGGWSDGSTGSSCARWLKNWGVVYRTKENGLELYSGDRAKQYGAYGCGGQGDGGKLDAVAKAHPCRHVVLVRTWDELAAALTAGFPVTVASNQGFSSRTDDVGVAAPSGVWMHQMCLVGIRFASQSPPGVRAVDAALCLNSWGPAWCSYAGKYPADQVAGSFWIERPVVERMLSQLDSWAIGRVDGWAWDKLDHGNWMEGAR
jgi:hypothetical protein